MTVQFSGLLLDGILALLLVAVIVACVIVYRRLGTIKAGQSELKLLVDQLNGAALVAQRSVEGLAASASDIESRLKLESDKASRIADELSLMTEVGNNLADRIANTIEKDHGVSGSDTSTTAQGENMGSGRTEGKKQQREILAALREAR